MKEHDSNPIAHLLTDDVYTIVAEDFEDAVRVMRDSGMSREDFLDGGPDTWRQLDDDEPVTVMQRTTGNVPAGATIIEVDACGDGWTRKATAPAWMWATAAFARGKGYDARLVSCTEW